LEDEILYDVAFVDYELMEEPEEVVKKFSIHQGKKDYEQDESCAVKTKQDAENFATKLLATRLEYYLNRFGMYHACVFASVSRRR
jgi:hypothetical protein